MANILRKPFLSLVLVLLTVGFSKTIAQQFPSPTPPSQPTPDTNPGGGNPDPTCVPGNCLVALH